MQAAARCTALARTRACLTILAVATLLAACGQRGPLYLPKTPPPPAQPTTGARPAAVPPAAPQRPERDGSAGERSGRD